MSSSAKSRSSALSYIKCFGCDGDDFCLSKWMRSISKVFTRWIVNDDPDINESEEIQKTTKRYLRWNASAEKTWLEDEWQTSWGLNAVRALSNHMVFKFSQSFDDMHLLLHEMHLPCTVKSAKCVSQLNVFHVSSLLSWECNVHRAHIKPSTITHPQTKKGCFANPKFTDGDLTWYFYGTLVCQVLVDVSEALGARWEGVMDATLQQFFVLMIR